MRNDTNPTPVNQAGCAATRCRTSGSSPLGPDQIGTCQPAERAAVTTSATTGADAHTISCVTPARRAASTCADTSEAAAGTTACETTGSSSRANAAVNEARPSVPNDVSSAMTPTRGWRPAR